MPSTSGKSWDLFICHSSEDKDEVARPLAELLARKSVSVWYDEFSLTLGDSLRRSIDKGLKYSKYGLVILSPSFFEKEWPQKELDGLAAREIDGTKVILPVWHKVGKEEVGKYSPMLADKLAVSTEPGLDKVVNAVVRAIKEAIELPTLNKKQEKKNAKTLSSKSILVHANIESINTGAISLDLALGIGGWPRGHIIEVFSPPSAGKTTLALSSANQTQALGERVLYIDADFGLIENAVLRCAVSLDKFTLIKPKHLEHAFALIIEFLKEFNGGLIVVDSIANLLPRKYHQLTNYEYLEEKDESHRQLIAQFLQVIQPLLSQTKSVLLLTNRLTEKVGFFLGSSETTPWVTRPVADAASIRVDLRRNVTIRSKDLVVGHVVRAEVIKNRFCPPYRQGTFSILFNTGIDNIGSLFDVAIEHNIIKQTHGHYKFMDRPIGNSNDRGREKTLQALRNKADLIELIKKKLAESI